MDNENKPNLEEEREVIPSDISTVQGEYFNIITSKIDETASKMGKETTEPVIRDDMIREYFNILKSEIEKTSKYVEYVAEHLNKSIDRLNNHISNEKLKNINQLELGMILYEYEFGNYVVTKLNKEDNTYELVSIDSDAEHKLLCQNNDILTNIFSKYSKWLIIKNMHYEIKIPTFEEFKNK